MFWVPMIACVTQSLLLVADLGAVVVLLIVLLSLFSFLSHKPPGTQTLNLLAVMTSAIVFLAIGWSQSLSLFTAIILLAVILKQLQAETKKHYEYVLVLCFFSTPLTFLFHQDLIYTIVTAVMWAFLVAALHCLNDPFNGKIQILKRTRFLLLLLPVALMLLFLLPKLPSFWAMPNQNSATTGLSDKLDPFEISKLSNSDDVAFRAIWSKSVPDTPLYWRAIVHDQFDGSTWKKSSWQDGETTLNISNEAPPTFTYSILAEPSGNNWLYGLGWSTSNHKSVMTRPVGTLFMSVPMTKKFEYNVESYEMPIRSMSEDAKAFYTQLVKNNNPQAIALANQLKQNSDNIERLIANLKDYFQQNGFSYSLEPPLYSQESSIDSFLFAGKKGFCGHFASSTAVILRAAGVPSRVVSGYLGGQYNPEQGYTLVRQYEAHAWVEYHDGRRWTTLDPTGWIAPERLNGSIFEQPSLRDDLLEQLGFSVFGINPYYLQSFIQNYYESLDYQWTKWVVSFDRDKQSSFFEQVLGPYWNLKTGSLAIGIVSVLLLGLFAYGGFATRQRVPVPIKLCKQLLNVTNLEGHSPISACNVIKQRYPELTFDVDAFSNAFMQYRYNEQIFTSLDAKRGVALIKKIKTKEKSQQ